ncbi:hypothetical protein KP791_000081 [Venturia canescens]|uniref:Uncharacterized protein n=1 Tax=Venturia canescens TaxID=32260 RepID=A0ACB9ZHJ2_9HYME|nr:uncharacterized LOC122408206 [Venturia canescens]KAI5630598.1 hypothetical protein KP791_000081 [Venturia canescens]
MLPVKKGQRLYLQSPPPYTPYGGPASENPGAWYAASSAPQITPSVVPGPQYPGNQYIVYCQHPPGTASPSNSSAVVHHSPQQSAEKATPITSTNQPEVEPSKLQKALNNDTAKNGKINKLPALFKEKRDKRSIEDTGSSGKTESTPKSNTSETTVITVPSNTEGTDIYPMIDIKEIENIVENDPAIGKAEKGVVKTLEAVADVLTADMAEAPNGSACKYKTFKCIRFTLIGLKYVAILAAASSIMYAAIRPLIEPASADSANNAGATDLIHHSAELLI